QSTVNSEFTIPMKRGFDITDWVEVSCKKPGFWLHLWVKPKILESNRVSGSLWVSLQIQSMRVVRPTNS
ncbi:hypothetical protein QT970_22395, partial [Microcoleus sp. herbarium8]|uniref:hypothetical protein n=1 Tax=Microcoleus sp. herbarium8 TaxID=3055436 RepID=UPI002FD186BE